MTKTYQVKGMTCQHCVRAVTAEVTGLDGVEAVAVDLAAATVTVTGSTFTDAEVSTAVDEAGYQLVPAG